jgi:hyperosmotically inducible protein
MTNTITRLLAAAALTAAALSPAYAAGQQEAAMAGAAVATADSALNSKVKAVLADFKGVSATINQGVVTLSGQVANTDTGTKAIQAVSTVDGVKEVKSELTVAK